jgi:hypothetical protein
MGTASSSSGSDSTVDVCLVEVGPAAKRRGEQSGARDVVATGGLGVAGDTLDRRIIHHAVAPRLGWGSRYRVLGGHADVPLWIFSALSRWHALSFLKSKKTLALLDEMVATADDPHAVRALRQLIDEDLSYLLHRAVERAKVELSRQRSVVPPPKSAISTSSSRWARCSQRAAAATGSSSKTTSSKPAWARARRSRPSARASAAAVASLASSFSSLTK